MVDDFCTPLDIKDIEQNFSEINPAMSRAEAVVEANRCLYCYDAPCTRACPTHIDVPSFIKKIASGNLIGSARVIFDANPIGATCARVCPVEVLCEGACVEKTLLQKPIEIGRLQRYATDYALNSSDKSFEHAESNGKSVGIVGSGPAGLSCAMYLARLGYEVTVYEKRSIAGGLDTYGMAEYKMTQAVSRAEVRQVAELGVRFKMNTEVIADIDSRTENAIRASELRSQHDAIFLGVGLGGTNRLNISGENLDGVIDALHFIEHVKRRDWKGVPLGRVVAVIGAGNTAVDAVTQAKRLGARRVMMIYRRSENDAPAYDYEMELARKDGIEFHWQTMPVAIIGASKVEGIKCRNANGEEIIISCDQVIKAIGQEKMGSVSSETFGIKTDETGRLVVNAEMQTSDPSIFAGGDCVNGGKEAVNASQMGKLAARGIHRALTGETVHLAGIE